MTITIPEVAVGFAAATLLHWALLALVVAYAYRAHRGRP